MDDKTYKLLLEKAYSELPEILKKHTRFETPQISATIQGGITVVQNLGEVSKAINRDVDMLAKYFLRELGTSGDHDNQRLTMKGQFRTQQLQDKFEIFLAEFVLCPDCGRPDTRIMQEKRISFLKCEACGSRHSIKKIKTKVRKEGETKPVVGDEFTVQITRTGKKGDGMAKLGNYIVFVSNAKEGQRVKAKIVGIQGTMIFAEAIEILGS